MEARERIILALDTPDAETALGLVQELGQEVGAFKIGLELFNTVGPPIFEQARRAGAERIFYDAKFCDIPNTVAGAARAAARHGVWLLNVHALGGAAMMRAAKQAVEEGAREAACPPPRVIAVTLLTSVDQASMTGELGLTGALEEQVVRLARQARDAGLDGVVASAREAAAVRAATSPEFLIVTPGVRPAGGAHGDQRRVVTPGDAIRAGSDYLVIGRSVTGAVNPRDALLPIVDEVARAAAASEG